VAPNIDVKPLPNLLTYVPAPLQRCFGWNDRGADQKPLTHSAMEARVQHPAEADVPL
jgi:hypothetical protein